MPSSPAPSVSRGITRGERSPEADVGATKRAKTQAEPPTEEKQPASAAAATNPTGVGSRRAPARPACLDCDESGCDSCASCFMTDPEELGGAEARTALGHIHAHLHHLHGTIESLRQRLQQARAAATAAEGKASGPIVGESGPSALAYTKAIADLTQATQRIDQLKKEDARKQGIIDNLVAEKHDAAQGDAQIVETFTQFRKTEKEQAQVIDRLNASVADAQSKQDRLTRQIESLGQAHTDLEKRCKELASRLKQAEGERDQARAWVLSDDDQQALDEGMYAVEQYAPVIEEAARRWIEHRHDRMGVDVRYSIQRSGISGSFIRPVAATPSQRPSILPVAAEVPTTQSVRSPRPRTPSARASSHGSDVEMDEESAGSETEDERIGKRTTAPRPKRTTRPSPDLPTELMPAVRRRVPPHALPITGAPEHRLIPGYTPRLRVRWMECTRRTMLENILSTQIWLGPTSLARTLAPDPERTPAEQIQNLGREMAKMLAPAIRYGMFPAVQTEASVFRQMAQLQFDLSTVRRKLLALPTDLEAQAPWYNYAANTPQPISYDVQDPAFAEFEAARTRLFTHYRNFWYRTHAVPMHGMALAINAECRAKGQTEPFSILDLEAIKDTNKRLWKLGGRMQDSMDAFWKAFVKLLIKNQCDLLLLLDPAIPFFDKCDAFPWVPDLSDSAPPYREQAQYADRRQPWRALYRLAPKEHPAHRSNAITLLTGRYGSGSAHQFERGREQPVTPWSVPDENELIPRPASRPDPDIEEWVMLSGGNAKAVPVFSDPLNPDETPAPPGTGALPPSTSSEPGSACAASA